METTTHSPEVQQALDEVLGSLQDALASAKEANDLAERLRGECARKDRIILEKVAAVEKAASAVKNPDQTLVEDLVDTLVETGSAKAADAKDLVTQLLAHPDNLVKLATRLATFSMPAPAQGVGIAKEASAPKYSDPNSGWGNVIRNGA